MHAKLMLMAAKMNLAADEMRSTWSSTQWREYFRKNAAALLHIPWDVGVSLTIDERNTIAASVQEFQLGESSDGHHFLFAARQYANASGDAQYVPALRRLVAEEQRHGRDLGHLLDLAGIERIRHAWADTVFRWLRRQAGLELSISILVTAEIIAQVYYLALRDATGSIVLRRLCDQILRDEDEHVRFQCERLAILRRDNAGWRVALKQFAQRFFFAGTCLVFWIKHSPVMRAGGYGFVAFWRASRRQLRTAIRLMDPRRYSRPLFRYSGEGLRRGLSNSVESSNEPPPQPSPGVPGEGANSPATSETLDLSGKWLEL